MQPQDLARTVEEAKKGRLEFRMDKTGIIHSPVGKASFQPSQLLENIAALIEAIVRATPPGIKGSLLRTASLTTTMGPSIKLNPSDLVSLKAET